MEDWKFTHIYDDAALKGLNEMFRTLKAHFIRAEREIKNNPITIIDVLEENKNGSKKGDDTGGH